MTNDTCHRYRHRAAAAAMQSNNGMQQPLPPALRLDPFPPYITRKTSKMLNVVWR